MSKLQKRTYARYTHQAIELLGKMIRLHRQELRLSSQDLASRVGISRTTLQKIESGDMACEVGLVFEAAALVGIPLFDEDPSSLKAMKKQVEGRIALLPKSVKPSKQDVDDEF